MIAHADEKFRPVRACEARKNYKSSSNDHTNNYSKLFNAICSTSSPMRDKTSKFQSTVTEKRKNVVLIRSPSDVSSSFLSIFSTRVQKILTTSVQNSKLKFYQKLSESSLRSLIVLYFRNKNIFQFSPSAFLHRNLLHLANTSHRLGSFE